MEVKAESHRPYGVLAFWEHYTLIEKAYILLLYTSNISIIYIVFKRLFFASLFWRECWATPNGA